MEEKVHDLTTKLRQRKKSTKNTDKHEVEGYFDLKTRRQNIMYTSPLQIYLSLVVNRKELLVSGCTKNNTKYAQNWSEGK